MNIGRNDPCSCGSNKKYKKCCMLKEYEQQQQQQQKEAIEFQEWFQKDCERGAKNLKEYNAIVQENISREGNNLIDFIK